MAARTHVQVVAEPDLSRRLRREAGALLAHEWGPAWRVEGHAGEHAPTFRAIACNGEGHIVGQVSAFWIPTDPALALVGLGDLVVKPRYRGRGIARRVCAEAFAACRERAADAVLVDTAAAAAVFRALGFVAVDGFSFHYETERACVRHRHWLVWSRAPLPPRVRLQEHGDF